MSYNDFQDDDIAYEIEGIRKFEHRPIPEFYKTDPRKTRTFFKEQATEHGVGYALIRACPEDTVKRYETLCHFESLTKSTHDHSFLIGIACQIIESELCRLLAEPFRSIGDVILEYLSRKNKKKPIEILRKWLDRQMPTMMGVIANIMRSLRYAIEDKEQTASEFIRQYFRDGYSSLLLTQNFIASYDRIRSDFRNPANHGVRIFSPQEYQKFAWLAVGRASVREWGRYGVSDDTSVQGKAIFHHHLAQSKLVSVDEDVRTEGKNIPKQLSEICCTLCGIRICEKDAFTCPKCGNTGICRDNCYDEAHRQCIRCSSEELPIGTSGIEAKKLADLKNPNLEFTIKVWSEKEGRRSGNRDFKTVPKEEFSQYKIGDKVQLFFESSEDAYVYLFNIGPTGNVSPIFPNEYSSDNHVRKGITYRFPDENSNFDWILDGPSGTEIVKAFATKTPVNISEFLDKLRSDKSRRDIKIVAKKDVEIVWADAMCTIVVRA